jgi:predicted small lipoprotein YifL
VSLPTGLEPACAATACPRAHRASLRVVAALMLATALAGCGGAGEERPPPARAWTDPGEKTAGAWTMYYNAYPAADLEPAMAEAYGIAPRGRGALVSVSLTRGGDPRAARDATVEIAARTLIGQTREVKTRRVERDGVVSWLGELDAGQREQLVFTVRASVPDAGAPIVAEFRREIYGGE